jgi:hypothetical protein
MRSRLSRRAVLRGAAGATLGLPLLEMMEGQAQAQMASPKRLIIVSVGHSLEVTRGGPDQWLPTGDFNALSPLLQPLVPHRDKLLVFAGIDNLLASSGLLPSNGHNLSSKSLLCCLPPRDAVDAAGNLRSPAPDVRINSTPAGPSVEYLLANAWNDQVLNLRVGERPSEHTRSFRMDGTLDVGNPNPLDAFEQLFRGAGSAPSAAQSAAERLRGKRKPILDAVKDHLNATMMRVGTEDRARLQRHAEHIRQFEMTLDRTVQLVCANPRFAPPSPLPAPALMEHEEARHDDVIAAAQIELMISAFLCRATRVAHLHFSNIQYNTFPFLNGGRDFVTGGWHGVIHNDAGTADQRLRTMRWYMQVYADLLKRLSETPDGTGTLMDNTLVLWISSLRSSNHGTENLPIVLAGNLKGALRTGRLIRYSPARTLGDFYTTLLNTLDVPVTSFGWNKGTVRGRPFVTGPLSGWT